MRHLFVMIVLLTALAAPVRAQTDTSRADLAHARGQATLARAGLLVQHQAQVRDWLSAMGAMLK